MNKHCSTFNFMIRQRPVVAVIFGASSFHQLNISSKHPKMFFNAAEGARMIIGTVRLGDCYGARLSDPNEMSWLGQKCGL